MRLLEEYGIDIPRFEVATSPKEAAKLAELFRYPVLRQLMLSAGTFPVSRGAGDEKAIARGVELLGRGELVVVFPQGTCLPFRERPWRRGADWLRASAPPEPGNVGFHPTERARRVSAAGEDRARLFARYALGSATACVGSIQNHSRPARK